MSIESVAWAMKVPIKAKTHPAQKPKPDTVRLGLTRFFLVCLADRVHTPDSGLFDDPKMTAYRPGMGLGVSAITNKWFETESGAGVDTVRAIRAALTAVGVLIERERPKNAPRRGKGRTGVETVPFYELNEQIDAADQSWLPAAYEEALAHTARRTSAQRYATLSAAMMYMRKYSLPVLTSSGYDIRSNPTYVQAHPEPGARADSPPDQPPVARTVQLVRDNTAPVTVSEPEEITLFAAPDGKKLPSPSPTVKVDRVERTWLDIDTYQAVDAYYAAAGEDVDTVPFKAAMMAALALREFGTLDLRDVPPPSIHAAIARLSAEPGGVGVAAAAAAKEHAAAGGERPVLQPDNLQRMLFALEDRYNITRSGPVIGMTKNRLRSFVGPKEEGHPHGGRWTFNELRRVWLTADDHKPNETYLRNGLSGNVPEQRRPYGGFRRAGGMDSIRVIEQVANNPAAYVLPADTWTPEMDGE